MVNVATRFKKKLEYKALLLNSSFQCQYTCIFVCVLGSMLMLMASAMNKWPESSLK